MAVVKLFLLRALQEIKGAYGTVRMKNLVDDISLQAVGTKDRLVGQLGGATKIFFEKLAVLQVFPSRTRKPFSSQAPTKLRRRWFNAVRLKKWVK